MRHLVVRFVRSVRPKPPTPTDERWARGYLTDAEWSLFAAQPVLDRSHGIAGARLVEAARPHTREAIEAALIHDVGKRHAALGVVGRSLATGLGWVLRSDRARRRWAADRGRRGRIGSYLRHDEVGSAEVEAAGGSALAIAWTRDHHHRDRFAALGGSDDVVATLDRADRDS